MESQDGTSDIVHPEVRAHISSLIAAVGGANPDDDGRYQLGDDALEVLRDIKRWIRFYDEKTNRMDVSRCIHGGNLVEGDLLPILSTWPENSAESRFKFKIALACLEVLVPLTWPMDRDKEKMTVNHHRHMPVLELAQVQYKRAIINYDGARILHTAVRTALPSLALPAGDRTARDSGIIKLVLFFLRNMAMISPPPNVRYDGDESQVSRSATIDAFAFQDIFLFLLAMASNMGDEFNTEDTAIMEIIYHLVKRVEVEKLFMNEQQASKARASELSSLMSKEAAMLQVHLRNAPTRHNRFGTMVWVKRDDGKMSSLSGQDALADTTRRNRKLDGSKTFKPPRRAAKDTAGERDLGLPTKLNARASGQLRSFVQDFLDSAFNPLFAHIRKTIDREASYVMQYHRRQFFHLVAWFLEAERIRRKSAKSTCVEQVSSFNLVAGVLNQEMFVTLNRGMHEAYEYKDWHELTAVMRCFTQILLTLQEMAESGNEEDEEIADNVMSRLFYEETTHDTIANIIKSYKDQGFEYLDAATELVHHFLRILEAYSKQNVDMQVRSRRRKQKRKTGDVDEGPEQDDDSANDAETAEQTSKERKFDFQKFAARFTPQGVVDTFVAFTKYYQELDDAQLKRAHRYFYRVAFKQDMSAMLFRVDIIHLLYNMIKGPEPLDKSSGMYRDWEELVKQILRKCTKKMEQRPELVVEMLFSKLQSTAFFLEFGYEKQTVTAKRVPRAAAELVFKYTEERDRQVAIAVGALLDKGSADDIGWVKAVVAEAESERRAWAAAEEAMAAQPEARAATVFKVDPDSDARRKAVFKDAHLRLLLSLCGFQPLGVAAEETPETQWVLPGDISADSLKDALHFINQAEFSPPVFDDGQSAEKQLKRKTVPRKKAEFDDDDDDDDDDVLDDDEGHFAPGGPTVRKVVDEKKKKGTRKRKAGKSVDDVELEERARKRRERETEKARRIKSALYVKEGDDEFDEEEDAAFYAREREIAARAARAAASAGEMAVPQKRKVGKDEEEGDDDDDDDSDEDVEEEDGGRKKRRMSFESDDVEDLDMMQEGSTRMELGEDADDVDEDLGTKIQGSTRMKLDEDADDADDAPVVVRRPRVRGGFVLDSDEDE